MRRPRTYSRRRTHGATLIEVMMSLAIVLVGMLALFRILGSAAVGSGTAARSNQALMRASLLLENMRQAPQATLACLASNNPDNWTVCETSCRALLTGASAPADLCVFTPASMAAIPGPAMATMGNGYASSGQSTDRAQQAYSLVYDGTRGVRDTFVRVTGANTRIYEMQITIGWNDSNVTGAIATATTYEHALTLRSGVFN